MDEGTECLLFPAFAVQAVKNKGARFAARKGNHLTTIGERISRQRGQTHADASGMSLSLSPPTVICSGCTAQPGKGLDSTRNAAFSPFPC